MAKYPLPVFSLTDLRNNHGISMAKLAAMLGVTPATVWHWEQRPSTELKPKQLRMLETVFMRSEVEALVHPERYFDENGNQIKDFYPDPAPAVEEEEEQQPQTTAPQETTAIWAGDMTTSLTGKELSTLLNELTAVFLSLDDEGKQELVQLADFLYHSRRGMKLPPVSASQIIDYAQIFSWEKA